MVMEMITYTKTQHYVKYKCMTFGFQIGINHQEQHHQIIPLHNHYDLSAYFELNQYFKDLYIQKILRIHFKNQSDILKYIE